MEAKLVVPAREDKAWAGLLASPSCIFPPAWVGGESISILLQGN